VFYEDFPSIPLILVITLQDRKTLFCIFLSFGDYFRLKLIWDFWSVNILSEEEEEEEEEEKEEQVNKMRPKAERVQVARAPCHAAPPMIVGASSLRCHPSSSPDAQLDLKSPIYIPPWTIAIRGGRET
jgi:hypothetical protein